MLSSFCSDDAINWIVMQNPKRTPEIKTGQNIRPQAYHLSMSVMFGGMFKLQNHGQQLGTACLKKFTSFSITIIHFGDLRL
jgi:hypothetical protein